MCKKFTSMNRLVGVTFVVMLLPCCVLGRASAQDKALATTEALVWAALPYLDMRIGHQPDFDSGIEFLEQALALAQTPEEHSKIGTLLARSYIWAHQKPDRAIELLQKVLQYDPEFEYCFTLYDGQLFEWRGRLHPPQEWEVERFPAGLPQTPGSLPPPQPKPSRYSIGLSARVALGDAYYHGKGDKEAGLREWETALESYPDAEALGGWVTRARRELGLIGALGDSPPMVVVGNICFTGNISEASDRLLVSAAELAQRLSLVAKELAQRLSLVAKTGSHGQVELASDARTLLLSAGSRQAVLDGATITLPVAPVTVKGKMLVPLRFVAEAFGHRVDWEPLPRIAWVR